MNAESSNERSTSSRAREWTVADILAILDRLPDIVRAISTAIATIRSADRITTVPTPNGLITFDPSARRS